MKVGTDIHNPFACIRINCDNLDYSDGFEIILNKYD